jgi:hypothetical protein
MICYLKFRRIESGIFNAHLLDHKQSGGQVIVNVAKRLKCRQQDYALRGRICQRPEGEKHGAVFATQVQI